MFEYLSYGLCFGILFLFLVHIFIRFKYGFWVVQPVFHVYDIGYYLNPPGIIDSSLPTKNKYTNFTDIDTILIRDLTSLQRQRFVNLIRTNYLQNKDNVFAPQSQHIWPYFIGHHDKSFVSFFHKDDHMLDVKKGTVINARQIVGAVTSRPLHITIHNGDKNARFTAYYVDYLCVDRLHRKQGIAPQLIQTHHHNQRHLNSNIVVSLFKREDELTGIVPLCVYWTYGFPVTTWTQPPPLSAEFTLLEINPTNFRFLHDFLKRHGGQFDIVIEVESSNLIELIKTKNIFVFAILCDHELCCCYFFRKSCVQIEENLEVLSCFASICHCEQDVFVQGFKQSFWKIAAEHFFGFAAIEQVSHNGVLIDNIMQKTRPTIVSPTAYFFYNFAYPTFPPDKVLILT